MANQIKGTQTEKNLLKAFAGESQARNRYTFFASVARKEGYEQIANIFTETAGNEKEHAEIFFKYLKGGDLEIIGTSFIRTLVMLSLIFAIIATASLIPAILEVTGSGGFFH